MGFAVCWEILGILTTADPLRGVRLLAIHVVGLLVYTFAAFLRFSPAEARLAARLLLVSPFLLLGMSLASFAASGTLAQAAQARAIESAVGRSNALATLFGAFIVLCLGTWVISVRHRLFASAGMFAGGLGLSLTGSRGGVLATLAGIGAYIWFGGRKDRRWEVLTLAGLALALILGLRALGITSTVEERIAGLERSYSWQSGPIRNVFIRLDYWRVSLLMLQDSPVLGQGLGSFERHYLKAGTFAVARSTDPHNQVFLLLGETGIVGTLAAGALVIALIRRARAGPAGGAERDWREVLFAAAVVGLAHSLVEPVFRNPSSVGLVATLLGLCANPTFIQPVAAFRTSRRQMPKGLPGVASGVPR
jgi:O-antigen ligase